MGGNLVAQSLKRGGGELFGLALDLLHGENVDLRAFEPFRDPVDAGPDRVDVPCGEAHGTTVPTARAQTPPCGSHVGSTHGNSIDNRSVGRSGRRIRVAARYRGA